MCLHYFRNLYILFHSYIHHCLNDHGVEKLNTHLQGKLFMPKGKKKPHHFY